MPGLESIVEDGDKRRELLADACRVLDLEVADKGGLSGIAVKGAYKIVQGVRPDFIREVVDHLLDDFLRALDPLYQEAVAKGQPPGAYLEANSGRMAEALLGITDRKAENAERAAIKKTYQRLRPGAKAHVEAAAPRLGELLQRYAPAAD